MKILIMLRKKSNLLLCMDGLVIIAVVRIVSMDLSIFYQLSIPKAIHYIRSKFPEGDFVSEFSSF